MVVQKGSGVSAMDDAVERGFNWKRSNRCSDDEGQEEKHLRISHLYPSLDYNAVMQIENNRLVFINE